MLQFQILQFVSCGFFACFCRNYKNTRWQPKQLNNLSFISLILLWIYHSFSFISELKIIDLLVYIIKWACEQFIITGIILFCIIIVTMSPKSVIHTDIYFRSLNLWTGNKHFKVIMVLLLMCYLILIYYRVLKENKNGEDLLHWSWVCWRTHHGRDCIQVF